MHSIISLPSRRLILITTSLTLICTALIPALAHAQSSGNGQRDCDANAVLRCGAYSTAEVKQKYNSQGGAKSIFHHFGISSTEVNQMHETAVNGYVTKGGRVLVNGKTVATDAQAAGRQNMAGSQTVTQNGTTFYTRPPSASFNQDKLPAYIVMKNGQFQYAVIKSCGNPVKASPTEKPRPKPQPAPVQPVVTPPPPPAQPLPSAPPQPPPTQVQIVETNQVVQVVAPAPAPVPVVLPQAGPGEVAGVSAVVGLASTFGYGLFEWLRRRYGLV